MPKKICILGVVDPAENHGDLREETVPEPAHEVEGVVVGNQHEIRPVGTVFLLVDRGELDEVTVPIEPLGIQVFHVDVFRTHGGFQNGGDAPVLILRPLVPLEIGMQDQDAFPWESQALGVLGRGRLGRQPCGDQHQSQQEAQPPADLRGASG